MMVTVGILKDRFAAPVDLRGKCWGEAAEDAVDDEDDDDDIVEDNGVRYNDIPALLRPTQIYYQT